MIITQWAISYLNWQLVSDNATFKGDAAEDKL